MRNDWRYGDVLRSAAAPENKALLMYVAPNEFPWMDDFAAKVLVETGGKFPSGLGAVTVYTGWNHEHWEKIDADPNP